MNGTNIGKFLRSKLTHQLDFRGTDFTFSHFVEDKYHRTDSTPVAIQLRGVYHQSTTYEKKTSQDGALINTKPKPMILCLYEDGSRLTKGDTVLIEGVEMTVSGVENVQQLSVAAQISLEVPNE